MTEKCKICASAQRDDIDRRLSAGGRLNSLRRVARDTGYSVRAIWNHSRHARESDADALGAATSDLRRLLGDWRRLHAKALKNGNIDAACRCLQSISDLQARLVAPSPRPGKVRLDESQPWCRIVFDDPLGGKPAQDARQFAALFLRLHGWRDLLAECLGSMLRDDATPKHVRSAAGEFLRVLSMEDADETLGQFAELDEAKSANRIDD